MFDFGLIPYWPWLLGTASLLGLIIGLIVGLVRGNGVGDTALTTVEATAYAALGAFGGIIGGLVGTDILANWALSLLIIAIGLIVLTGIVFGWLYGTAGVGMKISGTASFAIIGAALLAAGIYMWDLPRTDLAPTLIIILIVNGAAMGICTAVYKSGHLTFAWLLAFLNGSWSAISAMTGLLMHIGSWTFFAAAPAGARPRRVFPGSERKFFHCWENGMHLMPNYFFTQGPVMTAWSNYGMWHEAVHVMQHYIFGPIYLISYLVWGGLFGIIGGVIGFFSGNGISHGAFAWAYVNNPWEVWEYSTAWFGEPAGRRAVAQNVVRAGKQDTDLIFPDPLAWIVTVFWILVWMVGLITLLFI